MAIKIFRHNDLDGVASEIILRQKIDDGSITTTPCNHDIIDRLIVDLLKRWTPKEELEIYILDICPSKDTCIALHNGYTTGAIKVTLIDHHKTKAWVKQFPWATHKTDTCATQLVLDEVGLNPKFDAEAVHEFVEAVKAWDLHLVESKYRRRGEDLNNLFHFLEDLTFMRTFLENIKADLTADTLLFLKDILRDKTSRYIANIVEKQLSKSAYVMDNAGHSFKVILAAEHHSDVGHAILAHKDSQDLHYVIVANPITDTCSVYSRDAENIDVSEIALGFGGGGHMHAAGFSTDMRQKIKQQIAQLINIKS
jgi:hypothetical protein